MSAINNVGQVGFDTLRAAYPSTPKSVTSSALKGAMENQEMIHRDLQEMMKDIRPHLGQNVDMEA